MCRRRTVLSLRDILNLGFGHHSIAKVRAKEARGVKINSSPDNLRELCLHPEEVEPRRKSGVKLNHHVDVAVRSKIRTKHRSKERESANVISHAEISDSFLWKIDLRACHSKPAPARRHARERL